MTAAILLGLRLLLVVTLYAFLGTVMYLIWQDLRTNREILMEGRQPSIQIWIEGSLEHQDHTYHLSEITIGRDPASTFILTSETVSAQHAKLSHHHKQWWLEDLNSRNGTHLNGMQVTEPTVVTSGDQIRCGDVLLTIQEMDRL